MVEVFRDPIWQFIGVVLALATIALTVVVYRLQRKKKELAFGVLTRSQLLAVSEETQGRIRVTFDGNPVSNISLILAAVRNTGNVPIRPEDFEQPLRIDFGEAASVLSSVITNQPPGRGAQIEQSPHHVVLPPVLLNPGDTVIAKVLVSSPAELIQPELGIVGISRCVPLSNRRSFPARPTDHLQVALLTVLVGGFAVFGLLRLTSEERTVDRVTAGIYLLLVLLALTVSLVLYVRVLWKLRHHRYIEDA